MLYDPMINAAFCDDCSDKINSGEINEFAWGTKEELVPITPDELREKWFNERSAECVHCGNKLWIGPK